ncbi:invasion associated locus B family protein [Microvirga sp. GCM10011540]|uniref:invasion associated locus B family protein n=1 Tax=Microvirga sp. GCM10011540 TaxID=3317338 RepID=UPI003616B7C4
MKPTGIAIAFVAISSSTCAAAQTPRLLGTYDEWSAWSVKENKSNICYIHADALTKTPVELDHGRVSFSVRRLKRGKVRTEASMQAGYEFSPNAIRVSVDGKRFTMIPYGHNAWLQGTAREAEFARVLSKGRTMTVEAVSRRGNKTHYRFSLKGFTAALRKARRTCP